MKKIYDSPSSLLMKERLSMLDKLAKTSEQEIEVDKLKKQYHEFYALCDAFNSEFSSRGWIAYESMNAPTMRNALKLSKSKGINQANDYLIEYYDKGTVEVGIARLWGTEVFRVRFPLLKLAYEDYLCGRYHACIPVLLMMIDGVIADAGNNLGFFSDKSDVTAWDSISGHETGLSAIKSIFYSPRGKTEKNKITLPYRNGIMHGRDLGYANREVTAKCWGLLFSVRDVLVAKRDEESNRKTHELESAKSIEDIQRNMQVLQDGLQEVHEMDSYKRKPLLIGKDIPATGSADDYPSNSPEKTLVTFIELWQAKRYGPMAELIYLPSYLTKSKMAGRLRQTFIDKQPHHFSLVESSDLSSCKCDITVTIAIAYKDNYASDYTITFRLLYCALDSTELVVNPAKEGRWVIVDDFAIINRIGTRLDYL